MAKGFKHGAGGGAGLNFKVVGNPKPENPKDNTIWVNTDEKITGYDFSGRQPENPVEGSVWLYNGKSSVVEFNALKKNNIQVCPISAKQYIGGAYVKKEAKIYQDGAWKELALYAFFHGDNNESLTGGWKAVDRNWYLHGKIAPSLTFENGIMTVKVQWNAASNYYGGTVQTKQKIDFTDISTITFHVVEIDNDFGRGQLRVGVASDDSSHPYNMDAYCDISEPGYVTVDVSAIDVPCVIAFNPSTSGVANTIGLIAVDEIILS